MTSHKDPRIVWQVQARKSKAHKWFNVWRRKTRAGARDAACALRGEGETWRALGWVGYGFGNTRVVRLELPHKAKKEAA